MRFTHAAPRAAVVAALLLTLQLGCRPKDPIRTYRIAKQPGDSRPVATAPAEDPKPPTGEPTDRMIAAIVPGPTQAWFFKVVGPRDEIDPLADAALGLLRSVRFEGDTPVWDAPEGWQEERGGGMRLATLRPPGGGESELSVIGLGLSGDWDAQVLDNVNRWRKQLKLAPLTAESLDESVESLGKVAEGAVLMDEAGWFESGGMAPFAGRATPPPTAERPSIPTSPAGNQLAYETPEGWIADDKANSIRKVSLKTPGEAEVTGFVFPAAGMMGDPLFNANRWRGEIGLPPTTDEELDSQATTRELLGESEGQLFEFVGEEEATTVAMVQVGQGVWFFKLRGPKDEVAKESEAFSVWLGTLQLN